MTDDPAQDPGRRRPPVFAILLVLGLAAGVGLLLRSYGTPQAPPVTSPSPTARTPTPSAAPEPEPPPPEDLQRAETEERRGQKLEAAGQREEARAAYREALRLDPRRRHLGIQLYRLAELGGDARAAERWRPYVTGGS